jgi:hypothetical protein
MPGTKQADINTLYDCPRCGEFIVNFIISHSLKGILNDSIQKIALLSHAVRRMNRPLLTKDFVENILKGNLPNPSEQADNFILWLGENSGDYGRHIDIASDTHLSIIGAMTSISFIFIVESLQQKNLIEGNMRLRTGDDNAKVRLTFDGWKYYEDLKKGVIYSRKAFMALKFGDVTLDRVVDEVFKPAVKKTGFDLMRLSDNQRAGLIDDRMRVEIRTSRFLIADLTHDNAGAYWEAGYAEGLGKPVIYTCEKSKFKEKKTHFDTNHHLTIVWDADNPAESGETLKDTIRATMPEEAILIDK